MQQQNNYYYYEKLEEEEVDTELSKNKKYFEL